MKIKLSDHFTVRRLLRFTFPSMLMMVFTSVYSVVDGFFVSNYAGKTAFAAVNLIMPVLMVMSTFGLLLGTGGTSLVARTLGEGDRARANRYFSLFVYTALILGSAMALAGIACMRPLARFLGAEGALLENSVLYGRLILTTLPFMMLQMMFHSFFVAAEKPQLGFAVTVLSGVMNIVLDAVLVPVFPEDAKLIAAAVATCVSQLTGGAVPLMYFARKNDSLLRLGKTRFDASALRDAAVNGSSEFMTNISISLISLLYNAQLMRYAGENGIAAYGVMMYVSMIFTAVFVGYSMGVSPVVGYHYGGGNRAELKSLLQKSLAVVAVAGVTMVIAAQCMATPLARFFVGYDAELCALTESGFRIFALAFGFTGFGIFVSGFFTALGDGLTSAVISFVRVMVFEAGAVLLLPRVLGISGIFGAIVLSECLSLLLGTLLLFLKRKRFGYWNAA
ncbi:MAG: MATE family efflux transporter [Clostridia bacterium]|nr:MATE family efflux transporter [Clostridia bacterium]